MSTCCSKHVEAWNKYIEKSASSWSLTKIKDMRFQQFPGKNSREKTISSSVGLIAFGREGEVFSICVVLVRFFLDSLKVIILANPFFRFLHRLLNLPRLGEWRNSRGESGGHLSAKQEKKHPIFLFNFNIILPSTSRFPSGLFPSGFLTKAVYAHLYFPPYEPHALPFPLFFVLSPE
jgi:hypothetical protein